MLKIILLLLLLPSSAQAQILSSFVQGLPASGSSYIGPGDVVASSAGWWGLRAYSAATAGTSAIDIQRNSDSATCTAIPTLISNGHLDIASATPCAGSTVTSFCNATTCTISKFYDQTGHGAHVIQTTVANQPTLTFNCINTSLPCAVFNGTTNCMRATSALIPSLTQPYSLSAVVKRTSGFTTVGSFLGGSTASTVNATFKNVANQMGFFAGVSGTTIPGVTDNVDHAVQLIGNGASSSAYVDGSTTSLNSGTDPLTGIDIGGSTLCTATITPQAKFYEGGVWPGAFSGGVLTAMNSNQHTYWNF